MSDEYADDLASDDVSQENNDETVNERYQGKSFPFKRPFSRTPVIGQEIINLVEKLILPVKEFPRYNFVGKLLGPKGSTIKSLQGFCKVKMSVMGRGSTSDKRGEEELSKSDDPKYEHLKEPLHVLIQVKATKIEAHRRLSVALREINKFMGPANEEMMQQEQHIRGMEERPPILDFNREGGIQPIIRVGIPPPGAIILNEQPNLGRSTFPRKMKEERVPPRDSYAYEVAYNSNNNPETSDRGNFKRAEKRNNNAPLRGSYPLKRFKEEPYTSTSSYPSVHGYPVKRYKEVPYGSAPY